MNSKLVLKLIIIFLIQVILLQSAPYSLSYKTNWYNYTKNYSKDIKNTNCKIPFQCLSPKSKFNSITNKNYQSFFFKYQNFFQFNKISNKVFISFIKNSVKIYVFGMLKVSLHEIIKFFSFYKKNNSELEKTIETIDKNIKLNFWKYMHDSKIIFIEDYYKGQSEKKAADKLKEDIEKFLPKEINFNDLFQELPQAIDEVHEYFGKNRVYPIKKWIIFGGMMNLCINTTIKAILKKDGSNYNSYSTHQIIIPLFAINKDHGYTQGFNDYTNNDVIPRELIIHSKDGLLSTEPNEFFNETYEDKTPKDPNTYISIPFPKGDGVTLRKDGIEIKKFNPEAKRQTIIDFFTNEVSMYVNFCMVTNTNDQFTNISINDYSENFNNCFKICS